jgi:hypothetical protein
MNHRVLEVLKVAKHQVRLAQIAWLENAAEDDKADAEDSGEAEPERRAYYPPRAA